VTIAAAGAAVTICAAGICAAGAAGVSNATVSAAGSGTTAEARVEGQADCGDAHGGGGGGLGGTAIVVGTDRSSFGFRAKNAFRVVTQAGVGALEIFMDLEGRCFWIPRLEGSFLLTHTAAGVTAATAGGINGVGAVIIRCIGTGTCLSTGAAMVCGTIVLVAKHLLQLPWFSKLICMAPWFVIACMPSQLHFSSEPPIASLRSLSCASIPTWF
jgi:hypothetical protein